MDFGHKFQIIVFSCICLLSLSSTVPLTQNRGQGPVLESLHYPFLSGTYDSFLNDKDIPFRKISKRSTDWSLKLPVSAASRGSRKIAQASETVEVSSRSPQIVRRFQSQKNYTQQKQGNEKVKESTALSHESQKQFNSSSPPEGKSKHLIPPRDATEVNAKPPRLVRRMKAKNGSQQLKQNGENAEKLQSPNSEQFSSDGRGKIVRVRKFKKKPTRKTTTPKTTSTVKPTSPAPKTAASTPSDYAHITVINKQERNPKKNRKNKNKKHTNIWVPTTPFGDTAKQNSINYVTKLPEIEMNPNDYQTYKVNNPIIYAGSTHSPQFNAFGTVPVVNQRPSLNDNFGNRFSLPQRQSKDMKNFGNISPPAEEGIVQQVNQKFNADGNRKFSIPFEKFCCGSPPNFNEQKYKASPIVVDKPTDRIKPKIQQVEQPVTEHRMSSTISPAPHTPSLPTEDFVLVTQIPEERSGDGLLTNSNRESKLYTAKSPQIANATSRSVTKALEKSMEPTPLPRHPVQNVRLLNHEPLRQRRPVNLYNQQHPFMDPFFETPRMISPGPPNMFHESFGGYHQTPNGYHQPANGYSLMPTSLHLPFSQFYGSNEPQSEEYIFEPYPTSGGFVMPPFHHSPHLRSLRRSILDSYEDSTTAHPTTEFSIPKFEVPSIDFNDKGCKTVYKEVKSLPADGAKKRSSKETAKAFIMSRECYFPEGVPTTKAPDEKNKGNPATTPTAQEISKKIDEISSNIGATLK